MDLSQVGDFFVKVSAALATIIVPAAPIIIVYLQTHKTEKDADKMLLADKQKAISENERLKEKLRDCIERNAQL